MSATDTSSFSDGLRSVAYQSQRETSSLSLREQLNELVMFVWKVTCLHMSMNGG